MCSALDKTWAKWLSPICTLQWAATGQLVADLWLQAAQVCVLCVVHYITTVTRLQPAAHAGLWYRVPKVWPSIHKQQSRWIHSGTHGTLYALCKANTSMWIYTSHTHTRFQQMNILDCQRCCQTACSYTAELLIPHCIQFIECDVFTLQTQHQLLNFFPLSSLKGIYLFSSLNVAVKG